MERFRDPDLRESNDVKGDIADAGIEGDLNGVFLRCGNFWTCV